MKKTRLCIRFSILLVLCLQLIFSSLVFVHATDISTDSAREYAIEMLRIIDNDDKECPWNETTMVSSSVL